MSYFYFEHGVLLHGTSTYQQKIYEQAPDGKGDAIFRTCLYAIVTGWLLLEKEEEKEEEKDG